MCLGVPGRIVRVADAEHELAVVDVAGVQRVINISCVVDDEHPPAACVGMWVLVHVGFAMSRLDEEEARRTLELLRELDALQMEVDAMSNSASGVGRKVDTA